MPLTSFTSRYLLESSIIFAGSHYHFMISMIALVVPLATNDYFLDSEESKLGGVGMLFAVAFVILNSTFILVLSSKIIQLFTQHELLR